MKRAPDGLTVAQRYYRKHREKIRAKYKEVGDTRTTADRRAYRKKYFQEHKHEPRFKEYRKKSKFKHRVANRRKGRAYYRRTKEQVLQKHKAYRSLPEVKKQLLKYHQDDNKKHSDTNSVRYQKARIVRQKGKTTKRTPGFVYFFKSITPGYYKAGCTGNWKRRKRAYSGPAAVKQLYFLRPVPDKFYAETQLKIFLENAGYKPVGKSNRARICDWFVLEEEQIF
jgi:hypothetical protein